MNDKDGPWWKANFGVNVVVTKVQILNRGDCCGDRLKDAKVFVGDTLCGTIKKPEQGAWISVKCSV